MTTIEDMIRDEVLMFVPEEKTIITHIKNNYSPEDIFPDERLERWAISNGFVKAKG